MGWSGERQRHGMSTRGIKTTLSRKRGLRTETPKTLTFMVNNKLLNFYFISIPSQHLKILASPREVLKATKQQGAKIKLDDMKINDAYLYYDGTHYYSNINTEDWKVYGRYRR